MLLAFVKSLAMFVDEGSVAAFVRGWVMRHLRVDRTTLFFVDRARGQLWFKLSERGREVRFPMHVGIAGHVVTSGEVRPHPPSPTPPRLAHFPLLHALLLSPLPPLRFAPPLSLPLAFRPLPSPPLPFRSPPLPFPLTSSLPSPPVPYLNLP